MRGKKKNTEEKNIMFCSVSVFVFCKSVSVAFFLFNTYVQDTVQDAVPSSCLFYSTVPGNVFLSCLRLALASERLVEAPEPLNYEILQLQSSSSSSSSDGATNAPSLSTGSSYVDSPLSWL
jgi:hypothetical protein